MLHSSRFFALPRLGEGKLCQGEAVFLSEGGLRLGEPKGSPASEALPHLSKPEGSPTGEALPCLCEEKLRLDKPGTTA